MQRLRRIFTRVPLALRLVLILALSAALFITAYLTLPMMVDGLTVIVKQAPLITPGDEVAAGPLHEIYRRTFVGATVGSVYTELGQLRRIPLTESLGCPLESNNTAYTSDEFVFLWHGLSVQDYFAQSGTGCGFWDIKTLGIPGLSRSLTVQDTWPHLTALTGIPLDENWQCGACHLGSP